MRRIASMFAARRADKSDPPSVAPSAIDATPQNTIKKSRIFNSLSRKAAPPPLSQLSHTEPTASSSSSSSGSTTLPTPEDEILPRTKSKKSWQSWLGSNKVDLADVSSRHWDNSSQDWQPLPLGDVSPLSQSNEADDSSSSASEDDLELVSTPDPLIPAPSPIILSNARTHLRNLTKNKLQRSPPSSPLLQLPDSPLFPRSCSSSSSLPIRETMRIKLHRERLLQRLNHLSRQEELSIAPMGLRSPAMLIKRAPLDGDVDSYPRSSITSRSPGLRRWTSRPCYEDRVLMWKPEENTGIVKSSKVVGSHLGVAALEISEAVEFLAGLFDEIEDAEPPSPAPFSPYDESGPSWSPGVLAQAPAARPPADRASVSSPDKAAAAVPGLPMAASAVLPVQSDSHSAGAMGAVKSSRSAAISVRDGPLSMNLLDTARSMKSVPAESSEITSTANSKASVPPSPSNSKPLVSKPSEGDVTADMTSGTSRKGVRFAGEEKGDQIPLSYVLRTRKKREEKARFLREERERRTLAEERERHEEERRKREQEKRQWEEERQAWNKEKSKIEEERKLKAFAEEVQAARSRRDATRRGGRAASSSPARVDDPFIRERTSSRASHDPSLSSRKRGPELAVSTAGPFLHPSPPDSRPNSINGISPLTPVNQRNLSRPASVYSNHTMSSAEDVHLRENRTANKRSSSIVDPAKQLLPTPSPRLSQYGFYPWSGVPPIPQMPLMSPVAPMPFYPHVDMPLLPPSPPFMMQQYGYRQHSFNSSPQPHFPQAPANASLPHSHSSEGIHQAHPTSAPTSRSHSGPIAQHRRRASDEVAALITSQQSADRMSGSSGDLRDRRSSTLPPPAMRGTSPASSASRPRRPPPTPLQPPSMSSPQSHRTRVPSLAPT